MTVRHDATNHTFTFGTDNQQAELAYALPAPDTIDFVHTFVPENQRGQGVGEKLAEAGLAYARQQHLRVRTSCPYMASYVKHHAKEYNDLLAI